jgi:multidrug efflux pump subunit AcrB
LVTFAEQNRANGAAATEGARAAAVERLRPVLMTSLAMIAGMIPMALAFGAGGEETAPLGRAVIGGLMFATVATLLFVPSVYSLIHGFRRNQGESAEIEIPGE